jgi:hypothetical protein
MSIFGKYYDKLMKKHVWARPNMPVTFRIEVMPGRSREQRTFWIENVLPNGRVTLRDFAGEHHERAFEPVNFKK